MTIGVIGAMQMEVDDLKAQMTDTQTEVYSGVEFVEGKIGDQYVVAAKCGIGKVFAAICAEAMILKYDVDMIVNIGVAIGDVSISCCSTIWIHRQLEIRRDFSQASI